MKWLLIMTICGPGIHQQMAYTECRDAIMGIYRSELQCLRDRPEPYYHDDPALCRGGCRTEDFNCVDEKQYKARQKMNEQWQGKNQ